MDIEPVDAQKHGPKGLAVLKRLNELCDKFITEEGPKAMVQRLQ